jgi:hypothetical protein
LFGRAVSRLLGLPALLGPVFTNLVFLVLLVLLFLLFFLGLTLRIRKKAVNEANKRQNGRNDQDGKGGADDCCDSTCCFISTAFARGAWVVGVETAGAAEFDDVDLRDGEPASGWKKQGAARGPSLGDLRQGWYMLVERDVGEGEGEGLAG